MGGRAACVAPSSAPTAFRLLKASVAKPTMRKTTIRKTFQRAAAADPISGDSEISSGTLPERGFISGRTLHRHGRLRSDEFHVGAGISGVAPHYIPPPSTFNVLLDSYWFHVSAGIPGVAPHYTPPPSTFNVLLGSYWFDKPWFLSEGKLTAVHITPSSWGSQRTCVSRASMTLQGGAVVVAADPARSSSISAAENLDVQIFFSFDVSRVVVVAAEVLELLWIGRGVVLDASELVPVRNTQRWPSL
ncbi:hypothetical protein QYE76_055276 [Lolium multiflorum]|uniref:Uncharacterized protein n=1 Tax=Lolium multiflorum TaxID=4521 RepID=A0AAD8WLP7_LOLMU|nr:hypothetical protein QYE76_055276 [Lolium multiflorum]